MSEVLAERIERAVAFVDLPNVQHSARGRGSALDLVALLNYLGYGRQLVEVFVYVGLDPRNIEESLRRVHDFQRRGAVVRHKFAQVLPDGRLACDMDAEMLLDCLDFIEAGKPDIVVLVTGDKFFVPLAVRLRSRGIRVEVAGTEEVMAADLKRAANGFIDLAKFFDGEGELGNNHDFIEED